MLMSMKRLNKEYCCSPSAKQYARVLYELEIPKEAVKQTEKLFEEVPVLEETFASSGGTDAGEIKFDRQDFSAGDKKFSQSCMP